MPAQTFSERVFRHLYLERGLLAGATLFLVGLGLLAGLVVQWYGQNLGALEVRSTLRHALWGFTSLVLGVQTVYGSFFLSMLGMARRDEA